MKLFFALLTASLALALPATASAVAWGSVIDDGAGGSNLPACGYAYYTAWLPAWGYKDGRWGWWRCIPVGNYGGFWAPIVAP